MKYPVSYPRSQCLVNRFRIKKLIAASCLLAGFSSARASVPSSDITLQPVVTINLPVITSLTNYAYLNDSDAVSTVIGGTTINYDAPVYYPFDVDDTRWWDNLVADEIQGRLPVVMLPTRGCYTLTPGDLTGPGNLNPRRLTQYLDALTRAGATNQFKLTCFVDSPSLKDNYDHLYGYASTVKFDMANTTAWSDIIWLRTIKPWFDTIPSSYWYIYNGRPIIQWWSIAPAWFVNQPGNAKLMLQYISDQFNATYGVRPWFIIDGGWANSSNQDPSSVDQPDVLGVNSWFGPPSTSNTYTILDNFVAGTSVPGFINPNYFNPADPNYNSPNLIVQHNKIDGSGVNGDTLIAGLDAAVTNKANLTVIEGWNDVREWAGIYRAISSPRYNFPSQYINIVRQYTDLRTVTLRLEAEAADEYYDTTAGNSSGQVYRRSGDLDIRALSGNGWVVTNTAANEWIQFDKIYFSPGNYKFPIRYSATTAGKRVRLYVDGASLGDVTLPITASADTFDTINLGQKTIGWGTHTLKLQFLDGGVDVDWLFIRKFDPMISFHATTGYMTAELGGNATVTANRTSIGGWEKFSADDTNGGTLSANDVINLQTNDGLLLSAEGAGGGVLSANRRRAGSYEAFTIIKTDGTTGTLVNGDSVALRSSNGHYVTVGMGTGNPVDVSSTAIGPLQTFTITLGTQ
ncbi:MAG TPA: DUF5010 domain-containing protein [Rariglobus sp.]|nr:DUF5010 domain-containing protein [Rariglobus sp.]